MLTRSGDGTRFVTAWEQRVPAFFPNVTYELCHLVDKSIPGLGFYRYKLLRSDTLTASEGLVILESMGDGATQLTEYGFFNVCPNPIPAVMVWRKSVRGALVAIMAIKLRAENPDWSYERIAIEGERVAVGAAGRIDECVNGRHSRPLQYEADLLPKPFP